MTAPLIIFGSSRNDGGTMQAVSSVVQNRDAELIDLMEKTIGYYDYSHANRSDDFLPIAKQMAESAHIVFATPVYWYSMSAVLKTFFDRFTDLITIEKPIGRALQDKTCFVISAGFQKHIPEGFESPFKATFDYLNMQYGGCLYYYAGEDEKLVQESKERAKTFAEQIFN